MSMWFKSYTDRIDHPKMQKMMVLLKWDIQRTLGAHDILVSWVCRYAEDGILEKFDPVEIGFAATRNQETAEAYYRAAVKARIIDENPRRIHNWLEYFWPYLSNRYRNEHRNRLKEIKDSWEGLLGPRYDEDERTEASQKKIGAKKKRSASAPTNGQEAESVAAPTEKKSDKPDRKPRAKTNQQLILERFAKVRELDFSTSAAQKLICRANGAAAKELDELTEKNIALAFYFMDVVHAFKTEQMKEFSQQQGEEKTYKHLSALTKEWSEFGPTWNSLLENERIESLKQYEGIIAEMRGEGDNEPPR